MPEGRIWGCGMSCDILRAAAMRPSAPAEVVWGATVRPAADIGACSGVGRRGVGGGRAGAAARGVSAKDFMASSAKLKSAAVGAICCTGTAGTAGSSIGSVTGNSIRNCFSRRKRARWRDLRMCRPMEIVAHKRAASTRIDMARSIRMVTLKDSKAVWSEVPHSL